MSGSSSQTQSTVQEPWSQAQPYLKDIFGKAQGLANQPQQYFPASTVVPFSNQTQSGLNTLENIYSQSSPFGFDQLAGTVQDIAGRSQLPGAQALTNAANNPQTNPYGGQIAQAGQTPTNMGVSTLQQLSGQGPNPYLDQMFGRVSENIRDNVNSVFSQGGRYGSGAHQGVMGDSIGDAAASFYGNAYNQDQARRMGAAQSLAGISQADRAAGMQGLSTAAGLQESAYDRQLGAADRANAMTLNQNTQGLQAAQILPQVNEYQTANARGLMNVGGAYEDLGGRYLTDAMNRFNFAQQEPWQRLQMYNATVQPIAGMGGTATSTAPGQSALSGGIQGGLSGAMAGASVGGPPGALIGGGLGFLGGFL